MRGTHVNGELARCVFPACLGGWTAAMLFIILLPLPGKRISADVALVLIALGGSLGACAGLYNRRIPRIVGYWVIAFGALLFVPLEWISSSPIPAYLPLVVAYFPYEVVVRDVGSWHLVLTCHVLVATALAYFMAEARRPLAMVFLIMRDYESRDLLWR